jgi:hypothetical protein
MTAGVYDFTIEAGADYTALLTWQDASGNPIDITGWTAEMMIRTDYSSTTPLVTLSSGSGISLGGTAGTIAIDIPAAETAPLAEGLAIYDLLLTDATGKPMRLIQGTVTISPAVTR